MEKKITQKGFKQKHPRAYPKEIIEKVLSLVREGKTLKEIIPLVPCRKNAIRRYARKADLTIKK